MNQIFDRCSEEIQLFKEAFEKQYCSDAGDLTGYLGDDGNLSNDCFLASREIKILTLLFERWTTTSSSSWSLKESK